MPHDAITQRQFLEAIQGHIDNPHPSVKYNIACLIKEGNYHDAALALMQERDQECYFWGIHNQAELDLLIIKDGKRFGFEVKFTDSPKMTKSLNTSINVLQLDHVFLIYPGKMAFPLTEKVKAIPLQAYLLDR